MCSCFIKFQTERTIWKTLLKQIFNIWGNTKLYIVSNFCFTLSVVFGYFRVRKHCFKYLRILFSTSKQIITFYILKSLQNFCLDSTSWVNTKVLGDKFTVFDATINVIWLVLPLIFSVFMTFWSLMWFNLGNTSTINSKRFIA